MQIFLLRNGDLLLALFARKYIDNCIEKFQGGI
jgi:hypothetical protein